MVGYLSILKQNYICLEINSLGKCGFFSNKIFGQQPWIRKQFRVAFHQLMDLSISQFFAVNLVSKVLNP